MPPSPQKSLAWSMPANKRAGAPADDPVIALLALVGVDTDPEFVAHVRRHVTA
ncbi:MAG: hypothetical protein ABI310_08475 [Microbacteriaceae bacterium]